MSFLPVFRHPRRKPASTEEAAHYPNLGSQCGNSYDRCAASIWGWEVRARPGGIAQGPVSLRHTNNTRRNPLIRPLKNRNALKCLEQLWT